MLTVRVFNFFNGSFTFDAEASKGYMNKPFLCHLLKAEDKGGDIFSSLPQHLHVTPHGEVYVLASSEASIIPERMMTHINGVDMVYGAPLTRYRQCSWFDFIRGFVSPYMTLFSEVVEKYIPEVPEYGFDLHLILTDETDLVREFEGLELLEACGYHYGGVSVFKGDNSLTVIATRHHEVISEESIPKSVTLPFPSIKGMQLLSQAAALTAIPKVGAKPPFKTTIWEMEKLLERWGYRLGGHIDRKDFAVWCNDNLDLDDHRGRITITS